MFIENNNTKKGKKKRKKEKKEVGRNRTRHHRFDANTPNHYTTETDCGNVGKVFNLMPFA